LVAAEQVRVLVVGMGALGRVYSGALAGLADVRGLARTREQAERISSTGFVVRRSGRDDVVRLECHPRADDGWRASVGVLLTKSNDTPAAVAAARPVLAPDAPLITLQNGLGNVEMIIDALGSSRAAWGVSYVAGTAIDGDVAELVNPGETVFGAPATGLATVNHLAQALGAGGLPSRVSDRVERLAWFKVVMAGAMNVTGALSGLDVGGFWADAGWRLFVTALVDEGAAVAAAEGIVLDAAAITTGVAGIAARAPRTIPSMLQDVRRHRRTEVQALTGELVRRASRHGLAVPNLQDALDRMRRLQASWA
jgi:2-dehydropantoate 2-reductase